MSVIGLLVGAVVSIGTAVIGGVMNSNDVDEVNRIGQKNADRARDDQLKKDEWNKSLNRWEMRQSEKGFKQGIKEFEQGVKERGTERGLAQHQTAFSNMMGMVNQNSQLRQTFLNASQRGRK